MLLPCLCEVLRSCVLQILVTPTAARGHGAVAETQPKEEHHCNEDGSWGPMKAPLIQVSPGQRSSAALPPSSFWVRVMGQTEHSSLRGLGMNELTFENCLGDELEVLSITISRGSLKITPLKHPNK